MKDNEYLKALLRGDFESFSQLREVMLPSIRKLMGGKRPKEDVEDIFMEAILILIKKSKNPNFQLTSTVKTFLNSISRNLIWNKNRKKSSTHERTSEDVTKYSDMSMNLDTDFDDVKREALLAKAMVRLDEPCRKLLKLYYLEELSRKATAQEVGLTENHISHKSKHCREKLKKLIMSFPEYKDIYGD